MDLLPPLVVGVGILLPGLIEKSPFTIPVQLRRLVSTIACLSCWLAYYFVSGLAAKWRYEPGVTITVTALGIVILCLVATLAWNHKERLASRCLFLTYLLAIFLIAVAAGSWVGQQGITIITFQSEKPLPPIYLIRKANPANNVRLSPVDLPLGAKKWSWVFETSKSPPNEIEKFLIEGRSFLPGNLVTEYSGFPADRLHLSID